MQKMKAGSSLLSRAGERKFGCYIRALTGWAWVRGTQLIDAAKATAVDALELWCFQANERARRFYEARGFRPIRFTDGADNEERMPDVRYRWEHPMTTPFEEVEKRGSRSRKAM